MTLLAALTVKVSAILLLALMGALCLRRRSAAVRHWVLAVGVVAAAAAPALHVLPVLPAVEVAPTGAGVLGPAVASEAVAAVARGDVAGRLVVTIWLLGAVASGAVLLVGLARLRWLRASSSRVTDGPWHRLCVDLARSCGLKRGADLLFGPLPGLVATWGWRRPAVLLPAAASAWSAERMRVVLLHELAHARRGDWTLQMAAEALRCIWWFNPLAWMVRARLRRESEHAADDLVLAQGVPAATCATHLVELARDVRKHRRTWLPAPTMARPSHLERRLSAMLNPRTNRRPMTRLARVGSLGVLVLVSILVGSLQRAGAVEQQQPQPPAEPSTANSGTRAIDVEQLATMVAALDGRLRPVVDALHAVLNDPESGIDSFQLTFRRQPDGLDGNLRITHEGRVEMDFTVRQQPDGLGTPSNEPIRIGNGVRPPRKIHDVQPTYPPAARTAGIEGVVLLDATISPTGEVGDIEILRSVPELDQAAIDAVEQWRWEPTLVNGEPVSILMTITVNFMLP